MIKKYTTFLGVAAACIFSVTAETIVDVTGTGIEKITVSVDVKGDAAFSECLKKNLSLYGNFKLVKPSPMCALTVSGSAGGMVVAKGNGRQLSIPLAASDAKSSRMKARNFADKIVEKFAQRKGFAADPIVFVSRVSKNVSELCECYPDGYDVRQLTSAGKMVVGPRWKDENSVFYTGIVGAGPQVFEYNRLTNKSNVKWSFKGLATGAAVSPDGRNVALILSIHGNPELYVIDMQTRKWKRLTKTPYGNEGQPAWSPDGKRIVYVSDESRRQHLYVIDVNTGAKKRITTSGRQNNDPDWGPDGRIVFVSNRGAGRKIAMINPDVASSLEVLESIPGDWEHPSWSRDGRNVVAVRSDSLYIVDTFPKEKGGEDPKRVFKAAGKWITPTWRKL
jgi:TolB protein